MQIPAGDHARCACRDTWFDGPGESEPPTPCGVLGAAVRSVSATAERSLGATRVVVLGGGFGGVYTALHLERLLVKGAPLRVSLVNRENYLVFQPMLAEVVAGDVGILDTVSPLRQLLPHTDLFVREIEGIDLDRRVVTLGAGLTPQTLELPFDHLVVALGNVTDFRGVPGLPEHALPFKTLADAVRIRNHVINVLEQSSVVRDPDLRRTMLTFVVAGGGFSGTEVAAALNDFVRARRRALPLDPARGRAHRARAQRQERARARAHAATGHATPPTHSPSRASS